MPSGSGVAGGGVRPQWGLRRPGGLAAMAGSCHRLKGVHTPSFLSVSFPCHSAHRQLPVQVGLLLPGLEGCVKQVNPSCSASGPQDRYTVGLRASGICALNKAWKRAWRIFWVEREVEKERAERHVKSVHARCRPTPEKLLPWADPGPEESAMGASSPRGSLPYSF